MLKAAELKGIIAALPEVVSTETILQIMVSEAIKTSEIEGEIINSMEVMSSLKKILVYLRHMNQKIKMRLG